MKQKISLKLSHFHLDYWLLFSTILLVAIGLMMVASSSMVISDQHYHHPFYFLIHQGIYLALGVSGAIVVMRIPIAFWEKIGSYLLLFSLILLLIVLIPGIGHEVNGSRRWLAFGPLSLQVSEAVKFCVIIYLAGYLVRRQEEVRTRMRGFLKPMILLALISGLLLLEPDFGAATVIILTALGMLFLAGVRLWQFILLLLVVGALLALFAVAAPYRLERLTTFLHPWANQFSSGYQLTQSLIAFGRGGFFGVGLGNSIQKLYYLPEAHTDFLFAILTEELGLLGGLAVLGLFALLVIRALRIGWTAYFKEKLFAAYLACGFGLWIGLQAMINVGVNTGLLPTKGLTLPFISYGGSSLVINLLVVAVILRVGHELSVSD